MTVTDDRYPEVLLPCGRPHCDEVCGHSLIVRLSISDTSLSMCNRRHSTRPVRERNDSNIALILAALTLPALAFAQATDKSASKPDTGTEQAIMKLEQDLITALIKGDVGAIGPMVADTFFFTAPDGKTSSKAQFLADVTPAHVNVLASQVQDIKAPRRAPAPATSQAARENVNRL